MNQLHAAKEQAYGTGLRTTSRMGLQTGEVPTVLQQLKSPSNPKGPSQSARHITPSPGMKMAQSSRSLAGEAQKVVSQVKKVKYQIPNSGGQGSSVPERSKPAQPVESEPKEASLLHK